MLRRAVGLGPPAPQEPLPAAIAERFVAKQEYERNWVAESIPGAEGLTPREAPADPTVGMT